MRSYMLTLVLSPQIDAADQKGIEDIVSKFVGKGTNVKEVVLMGKKRLSYPIKKQSEGIFVKANLSAPALTVDWFGKQVNVVDSVLRYMLTA